VLFLLLGYYEYYNHEHLCTLFFFCGPKFLFLLVTSFEHLTVLILIFRYLFLHVVHCRVLASFFGTWIPIQWNKLLKRLLTSL
jgi:hypothetical protein